jgi:hypothetical protein
MNYKALILLVGVATLSVGFYIYKKSKNDLPTFDEGTNTIKMKGNTYSAKGVLVKCVVAPCYDNLPN